MKPTSELYLSLQSAYDLFNERLFGSVLPAVIFTVQRKPGVMGYFAGDRWSDSEGKIVSEIAINPSYIARSRLIEVMQTLVHEMVHCWQHFHGNPGRKYYHNAEWAKKMIEIGLMPSSTGEPGGKITGQFMGDYILEDGRFLVVFNELERNNEISLHWVDRKALPRLYEPVIAGQYPQESNEGGNDIGLDVSSSLEDEGAKEPSYLTIPDSDGTKFTGISNQPLLPEDLQLHEVPKRKTRIRYQCPGCDAIVYGRPKLNVICGECDIPFEGEIIL